MYGINRKMVSLDNKLWEMDIAQFMRWRSHFDKVTNIKYKQVCIERMQTIKERYPQHMKNMHVPSI